MSRQYYESTVKGLSHRAYDLLLITRDDRAMKNPGRFEGDSCSDGYEDDDSDPTRRGASEVTIVTERVRTGYQNVSSNSPGRRT